jgi:PleD family two-component response regulator
VDLIDQDLASQNRKESDLTRGTQVLVVDNDPDDLIRMKIGLEEYGYKVYGYQNPSMAIQEISNDSKDQKHDIILYDINMPELDWFAFATQVRKADENVKIFLMSTSGIDDVVIHKAMSLGVSEVIKKPLSIENLNILLQNYMDGIENPLESPLKL